METENNRSEMDLIASYLAGEASPEQAMELDDWLTDPVNKKEFDRVVLLWDQLPGNISSRMPDKKEAWLKLLGSREVERIPRIRLQWYAAAACIAAIVFIAVMFSGNKNGASYSEPENISKRAGNEVKNDTIPDGSTLVLNKNSSITYTSDFNKARREIDLTGECFFDIVPDKTKPFIISMDDLKIKVVGTSFNVRTIPLDKSIEVQVVTGVVKMYTSREEITVTKGQTGVYRNNNLAIKDTVDMNSLGYATKTLTFNDIPLVDACSYLEKAFNVIIKIDKEKFAGCRITAQFHQKSLLYILDIINATLNTTYKQDLNTFYINGNGCQ